MINQNKTSFKTIFLSLKNFTEKLAAFQVEIKEPKAGGAKAM